MNFTSGNAGTIVLSMSIGKELSYMSEVMQRRRSGEERRKHPYFLAYPQCFRRGTGNTPRFLVAKEPTSKENDQDPRDISPWAELLTTALKLNFD